MNKKQFGLCLFSALAPFAMQASDIYVSHLEDGSGAPFYNGAPSGAYVTNDLQAAVDHAAAGDTVWVEDGQKLLYNLHESLLAFDVLSGQEASLWA